MADTQKSSKLAFFKGFVPSKQLLIRYFNKLNDPEQKVYLLITSGGQLKIPSIYVEKEKDHNFCCKVFTDEEEAVIYKEFLLSKKPNLRFHVWKCSLLDLFDFLLEFNKKMTETSSTFTMTAYSSMLSHEEFHDIDVLWSSNQEHII